MTRRLRWPLVVGILAVITLIMLTASFHIARSETQTSSSLTRSSSYHSGAEKMVDTRRVFLHVENRVGVASALASEIRRRLSDSSSFEVVLLNNDPEPDDYPLLLVGVRDKHVLWTPFYGRADFRVAIAYASYASDIALDDNASIRFDGSTDEGELPLRIRGNIEVTDTTLGLITRPGYRRMLATPAAQAIAEYLQESIQKVQQESAKHWDNQGQ